MKRILTVAMFLGLMLSLVGAVPATAAAPAKGEVLYQQWLDQTAVIVTVNGVTTSYTERQVGQPEVQAAMHLKLTGGVTTNAVYWGCPDGIGCTSRDANGFGWQARWAIGTYGTNACWNFVQFMNNSTSSASADYGSGWDLKLYSQANCGSNFGETYAAVLTSHSVNFTGPLAFFNDLASSAEITQAG